MKLTVPQVKKLQQVELRLFKSFLTICEKEKLRYFLIGGTLIGAVRHKGFIPWDDDIDIGMPRKDYEKFIQVASRYLPDCYFLQTMKSDRNYPYPFAKIRDNNTLYLEDLLAHQEMHHGIWIDIFPLDYCSPRNKAWYALYRIVNKRVISQFQKVTHWRNFCWKYLLKIFLPSCKKAKNLRENLMQHYPLDTGYIGNLTGRYGLGEIVPSTWFKESAWLEFEGLKISAPIEYHKYLTHIYGDYMQLPPEEKRTSLHAVTEINFNVNNGESK